MMAWSGGRESFVDGGPMTPLRDRRCVVGVQYDDDGTTSITS